MQWLLFSLTSPYSLLDNIYVIFQKMSVAIQQFGWNWYYCFNSGPSFWLVPQMKPHNRDTEYSSEKKCANNIWNISAHSRSTTTIGQSCQKSFSANIDFRHIFVRRTESIFHSSCSTTFSVSSLGPPCCFTLWEWTWILVADLEAVWLHLQEEREGAWEEVRRRGWRRRRRGTVKPGRNIEAGRVEEGNWEEEEEKKEVLLHESRIFL